MSNAELIDSLPKAELHLHIEGTLEPEQLFEFAGRNGVSLRHKDVSALRQAYQFHNLQSFLDLYYEATDVIRTERDFHELAMAYFARAAADNIVHAELFFDPQSHIHRGIPFGVMFEGLHAAVSEAQARYGITASLIMCFLRHLDEADAFATLDQAEPYLDRIIGVGLDSGEVGNPPEKFREVFARAAGLGLRRVAHAGEEGPPAYISGALDALDVARIDHGVRCVEDEALVERLVDAQIPLTVCPLSNVRLAVFPDMAAHNVKHMLEQGLKVTINSDDPAYFGGYLNDNFHAVDEALGLTRDEIVCLALNSIEAAFLPDADKAAHIARIREVAAG